MSNQYVNWRDERGGCGSEIVIGRWGFNPRTIEIKKTVEDYFFSVGSSKQESIESWDNGWVCYQSYQNYIR